MSELGHVTRKDLPWWARPVPPSHLGRGARIWPSREPGETFAPRAGAEGSPPPGREPLPSPPRFGSTVESWQPEMVPVSQDSLQSAWR